MLANHISFFSKKKVKKKTDRLNQYCVDAVSGTNTKIRNASKIPINLNYAV